MKENISRTRNKAKNPRKFNKIKSKTFNSTKHNPNNLNLKSQEKS